MFHGEQSSHNAGAKDRLGAPDREYRDWEITILFYAALHLVDGHCVRNGLEKAKNHKRRRRIVKKGIDHVHPEYEQLWDLSLQARYIKGHAMDPDGLDLARGLYEKLAESLSRN